MREQSSRPSSSSHKDASASPSLTMEQREAALSAQIRQMNITSNEAAQIGRETLQTLDGQDKELKQTNHQLEATGYMIDQSKRALENMTYKGWLYNKLFASDLKDPHATKASTGSLDKHPSIAETKQADAAIAVRVAMNSTNRFDSQQDHVFSTTAKHDHRNQSEDDENLRDVLAATNGISYILPSRSFYCEHSSCCML